MSTNLQIVVEQLITAQCENKKLITSLFLFFVHFPFYFRIPVFQHGASLVLYIIAKNTRCLI